MGYTTWAQEFKEEIVLYTSESAIEFSRNTSGSIGVDSMGRIHIVYGIPDEVSKPPANQILYQMIEENSVSSPVRVDSGDMGGGRHPSLVIDAEDTIHVVWHDYRHTSVAGNYMDNVEIYYDKKTVNHSFSDMDIRLTTTNAGHQGDNGYVPQISAGIENQLHIAWYDFSLNGNNADIYLISSDSNGDFPIQEGIESFRITSVEQNPDDYTSNWAPDLAALPDGSIYVIWGFLRGWQGAYELKGVSVNSDRVLSSIKTIAPKGGRFNDPPRLVADSEGNLALVSTEYVDGFYQVNLHYKSFGGDWQGPVIVNDGTLDASQPCAAFRSPTELLIVWQEDLGGLNQIVLAQVNPLTMVINNRTILSQIDRDAKTPAISSHPGSGKTVAAWIEHGWDGEYSIVLRETEEADVTPWLLY